MSATALHAQQSAAHRPPSTHRPELRSTALASNCRRTRHERVIWPGHAENVSLRRLTAVAIGLTDAERAGRLRVAPAPVNNHLNHVLAKTRL